VPSADAAADDAQRQSAQAAQLASFCRETQFIL
jgi:hypothetical protein